MASAEIPKAGVVFLWQWSVALLLYKACVQLFLGELDMGAGLRFFAVDIPAKGFSTRHIDRVEVNDDASQIFERSDRETE
jgi:hypothetical protein